MNAMTWFDHETNSIWSQPWGIAISGPLKGTRLDMLPFSLAPWASWRAEHPDTLALNTSAVRYGGDRERPLKGSLLKQIPYTPAFDWAWLDFYPDSPFYGA